jgi:hypothetical protein
MLCGFAFGRIEDHFALYKPRQGKDVRPNAWLTDA